MAAVVKAGTSAPRTAPTLPPLRYSAAAAMGTSTAPTQTTTPAVVVPQTPAAPAPPPRAPTPPVVAATPALSQTTTNASTTSASSLQQTTPLTKSATPASDQAAPLSPSERAISSAVVSPVASPVAARERESSLGLGHSGSYGGAPSAPSVTSMSLASPVVSVVEAPASKFLIVHESIVLLDSPVAILASPQVSRMSNPTPLTTESTTASVQNPQYTLQGILPQHSASHHPGMVLNGLREVGNTSTMTMKPEGVAHTRIGISPSDELAVGSNAANNGAGAIGSAYGQAQSVSPPGVSTNGHEERNQPQAGGQQAPKFAATLSDLMSSFKSVGLKGMPEFYERSLFANVL